MLQACFNPTLLKPLSMETYINRDLRENLLIVFMHMDVQHYLNTENAIYVMSGWHRIKIGKQKKYTNIP